METPQPLPPVVRVPWYRERHWVIFIPVALVPTFLAVYFIFGYLKIRKEERSRPTFYAARQEFPYEKLPFDAFDIHYVSPGPVFAPIGLAYECKCTEAGYREWVAMMQVKYPEIGDIREEKDGVSFTISARGEMKQVRIGRYLISEWKFEDQGLHLEYNLKTGRAFRWSHSR